MITLPCDLPALLRSIALAHGLTLAQIRAHNGRGRNANHRAMAARAEFAYRAATAAPHRSNAAIGRLINRTGWTIRYLIGVYCHAHGLPCPRAAQGRRDLTLEYIARAYRRESLYSQGLVI